MVILLMFMSGTIMNWSEFCYFRDFLNVLKENRYGLAFVMKEIAIEM